MLIPQKGSFYLLYTLFNITTLQELHDEEYTTNESKGWAVVPSEIVHLKI